MAATVGTGSLARKSRTIEFTRWGFSWVRKCEVPRDDGQLCVGKCVVHLDGVG
jgi:hypothetical protein